METIIDQIKPQRAALPMVATLPDLPVLGVGALATLPAFTGRTMALSSAAFPVPAVRSEKLPTLRRSPARLSPLPTMAMSIAKIAGRHLPMFEAMDRCFTVASLKRLAGLSPSARLMKIGANGKGTLLHDDDVIDLMEDSELQVVRRSWAS